MNFLKYNSDNMFIGLSKNDLKKFQPKIKQAEAALKNLQASGQQGFFNLPFDIPGAKTIEKKAKEVQKKFSRLLVIGIGGSDLGARAVWQACPGKKMEVVFLSNTDPDTVAMVLNLSPEEWKKTAINVVSKSGSTVETMSNFMVARERLIRSIGQTAHRAHIYVTTEVDGKLALWATEQGYEVLAHPKNVGGRFSVLSLVGLFPVACGGVPITRLLAGAREVVYSEAANFAALQFLAYKKGQEIQVLMPYSDSLGNFPFWYRQLWAESLGKKGQGPTPIAARGTIDQHSQIQLYNDGPNNKTITFIEIEKFKNRIKIPKNIPGLDHVSDKDFSDLMHSELHGTAEALKKNKRMNGKISIPTLSPESLGALFQFFILAAAFSGEFYGINAYNQPGVEEGKRLARKELAGQKA
ncbi:MAG: Glucose-6-phosphate isomerase [Candidatus Uhrbacteria bacterium GW2011_GWE2_45_35]|uniref:Glucose-6-phosphate isomerase n=2 Tax=Candidatus Uhriibacteriota TaxID=1752732 RepID=A0A0G1LT60_9BACT|nr:MAG: Glucose-6-phosphate isomerase [Candidatus Uhrbacteria bacterium GW2011_GWF2_44_350]KKU09098.1 MAG: Glucose-6-phosphate isomerase [Candidatus Uhrbacteria bacterium GW2011_GWE2_45_35]